MNDPPPGTKWFAGGMPKRAADDMVLSGTHGDYLIRTEGDIYVISINDSSTCANYKIRVDGNELVFAGKKFPSLESIIDMMKKQPICGNNGRPLILRQPATRGSGPNRPTMEQRAALAAKLTGPPKVAPFNGGQRTPVATKPSNQERMVLMQQQQAGARGIGTAPPMQRMPQQQHLAQRNDVVSPPRNGGGGRVGGGSGGGGGGRPTIEERMALLNPGSGPPGQRTQRPPGSQQPQLRPQQQRPPQQRPQSQVQPDLDAVRRRQMQGAPRSASSHQRINPALMQPRPNNTAVSGVKGVKSDATQVVTKVKLTRQPHFGFGITLNDISPMGVMVAAVKEGLKGKVKPGMKIKAVNNIDCEHKNVQFVKNLLTGTDEATIAFLPDPRATGITDAEGELALYIAPIDISGYEKLSVNAVSADVIETSCRGKMFNRYVDILPYPKTQVKLKEIPGIVTSTYINANFVRGYYGEPKYYIAAQGPLPTTVTSFVRMMWEQQCRICIQVTGFTENRKRKCERYFPVSVGEAGAIDYDGIVCLLRSTKLKKGYQVSTLELSCEGHPTQIVLHYWFIAWPDHGVPVDGSGQLCPDNVLGMMEEIRGQNSSLQAAAPPGVEQPPILVHCSAGVGRTGTIIVIDHVMNAIWRADKVDLNHIIKTVREDRMALVQHTVQYKFAYQAVINFAETALKDLKGDIYELPSISNESENDARSPTKTNSAGDYESVVQGDRKIKRFKQGSISLKAEQSDKSVYKGHLDRLAEDAEEEEPEVDTLEDEPWYYGPLPRAAMKATLEDAPIGSFGVRSSETQPGCYVLTLQQKDSGPDGKRMLSILIKPHVDDKTTKFRLDQCSDKLFDSVPELIRYFREHKVMYVDDNTNEQHLLFLNPN
eukprot:m.74029 g.74029  ORF g.74029 m.74029 type:complete len:881 (-) comp24616_c0_seq1:127-2769(-)